MQSLARDAKLPSYTRKDEEKKKRQHLGKVTAAKEKVSKRNTECNKQRVALS